MKIVKSVNYFCVKIIANAKLGVKTTSLVFHNFIFALPSPYTCPKGFR